MHTHSVHTCTHEIIHTYHIRTCHQEFSEATDVEMKWRDENF